MENHSAKKGQPLLSVIMPVFNEKATVAEAVERVLALPVSKELLVVDDCSTDGSREILEDLQKKLDFRLINNTVNSGKGSSVRRALNSAGGKYILIEDADLELDIKEIMPVIETMEKDPGIDMVNCYRQNERGIQPPLISFFAKALTVITFFILYGRKINDILCTYKPARLGKIKALDLKAGRFELETETLIKALKKGYNIKQMPIKYKPRSHKEGKKINWQDGFGIIWQLFKLRFSKG
jgi:dolichol-phosphate mannosyltransferase